ncbi:2-hydroxychromene-2-carboxylate isomerase [Natronocella acetinitrilica]|jgi:2-hydroxychromene-2-carboxylate isomerase|uniref:2-hydroxychromene-2-carboxylate isomerase n=1 Tax=Natronocella acetinitrilica TaxID=414046 RepID=A0AAE3KCR0_9GAMM|nr:2-hydroxychromene-2-carboxylate isomerase [Natronocella acetinitrilica]MCP1676041.1 2-hydroxychromene-2-carboxylate isomerase [Natronocella acetinitrilica]
MQIEFFFDTVSPYSYVAASQVPALERRTGATVRWRPFFLGGLFKTIGNRAPLELPAKARYLWHDLERLARFHGIALRKPDNFPFNSLTAQRALAAMDDDACRAAAQQLFQARWAEGRPIDEEQSLTGILGSEALAGAGTAGARDALKANTEEAAERGAFGAPTFFIGDALFFGCDRLHIIEAELLAGR